MILFTIISFIPWKDALAEGYANYQPFPINTIGISRPNIQMKFEFFGVQVSSYQMMLNGSKVPVQFNKNTLIFYYTPQNPLPSGQYNVKLTVHFQRYGTEDFKWSFQIAKNAINTLPIPNGNQEEAIKAVNAFRARLSIPLLKTNNSLDASAKAHARYMLRNLVFSHFENKGSEGYVGKNPIDRTVYFGYYNYGVSEDIHNGTTPSPIMAINSLFDAPYHRMPFMNPDIIEMGYGKSESMFLGESDYYQVIDFGRSKGTTTVVVTSPADNEQLIPVSWDGHEYPDPLRIHSGISYPVGYPIVLGVYGDKVQSITIESAQLTSPNSIESLLWNSAGNDNPDNELNNSIILIPRNSLQSGTVYNVDVNLLANMNDGTQHTIHKNWSFTTESEVGLEQEQLRKTVYDSYKHVIKFGLDDKELSIDHTIYSMVVPPVIINNHTYLAIRDLEKALLANVKWDNVNKAAIYIKGNKTVTLYTNRDSYKLNNELKATKTPAILKKTGYEIYRTMVPVRLLAESLGCTVDYDNQTRSVIIHY